MVQIIADLHLHSKYSRAVSPQMTPPVMAQYGAQKGIDLLTTGDWTHPMWLREIRSQLEETSEGIFQLKSQSSNLKTTTQNSNQGTDSGLPASGRVARMTNFLLSVEIANIFTQNGRGRRIHNLVFSPSFEVCEKINKEMVTRGFNITSDGRPIIGLSSKNLLEMVLGIDERCLLIPCHVWTPWFGLYGAASGFDSIEESFEELSKYVYGVETGLSSDPEMNWQIKELETRSILSFSDAHSPAKMGREATVFELEKLSYENIRAAIMQPSLRHSGGNKVTDRISSRDAIASLQHDKSKNKVFYTIEFYPEEGKYHYSGHRNCNITMTPEEQRESKGICPVCKRHVTDGVMRRVQELADKKLMINDEGLMIKTKQNDLGLKWYIDPQKIHPPYVKLVPLNEIVAEAIGSPVGSPKVKVIFDELCKKLDSEINILLKTPISEIEKISGSKIAEGVEKVRTANIVIKPGYDGVYGVVKIWSASNAAAPQSNAVGSEKKDAMLNVATSIEEQKTQMGLDL